jgi:23S rRNA pseudouridine955/2504/2580 synthase
MIEIPATDDGQRLERWLKSKYPNVPYAMIQKSLRNGDIRVDGKKAQADFRLAGGMKLRLPPVFKYNDVPVGERKLSKAEMQQARDMVIYEDKDIIVLNKPSGLATQGGGKNTRHIDYMLKAFEDKEGEKPKLVHRLDKDTSGVLVVARNRRVAQRMGDIFKYREAKKTYLAITIDKPRTHEDTIRLRLTKAEDRVVVDKKDGKDAVTDYRLISFSDRNAALIALRPETGRMHQIRVHLAHIKCPILGDEKYGGHVEEGMLAEASAERIWLHALALYFPHPITGKPMEFFAPVPHPMRRHLEDWHMEVEGVTDTAKPLDPMEDRQKLWI